MIAGKVRQDGHVELYLVNASLTEGVGADLHGDPLATPIAKLAEATLHGHRILSGEPCWFQCPRPAPADGAHVAGGPAQATGQVGDEMGNGRLAVGARHPDALEPPARPVVHMSGQRASAMLEIGHHHARAAFRLQPGREGALCQNGHRAVATGLDHVVVPVRALAGDRHERVARKDLTGIHRQPLYLHLGRVRVFQQEPQGDAHADSPSGRTPRRRMERAATRPKTGAATLPPPRASPLGSLTTTTMTNRGSDTGAMPANSAT